MPFDTDYRPPFYLRNGHLQSILPTLFRKPKPPPFSRERIETPDHDFLDLDWSTVPPNDSPRRILAILSHGLEGNTRRAYIHGMVGALNGAGVDALAWNYRGCSGEVNRQPVMYHNGATADLDAVVQHAVSKERYDAIFLIGFSMGGNMSLLYAGQQEDRVHPLVKGVVGFSAPCDLAVGGEQLARPECTVYMKRFLKKFHRKIRRKMAQYPDLLNDDGFEEIQNFHQFDDRYTAPLHGFASAQDYYEKCSCLRVLDRIKVPSLLVNAADDPFLAGGCYPREAARNHRYLKLEIPRWGGHMGFMANGPIFWSEKRVLAFIPEILGA